MGSLGERQFGIGEALERGCFGNSGFGKGWFVRGVVCEKRGLGEW